MLLVVVLQALRHEHRRSPGHRAVRRCAHHGHPGDAAAVAIPLGRGIAAGGRVPPGHRPDHCPRRHGPQRADAPVQDARHASAVHVQQGGQRQRLRQGARAQGALRPHHCPGAQPGHPVGHSGPGAGELRARRPRQRRLRPALGAARRRAPARLPRGGDFQVHRAVPGQPACVRGVQHPRRRVRVPDRVAQCAGPLRPAAGRHSRCDAQALRGALRRAVRADDAQRERHGEDHHPFRRHVRLV
mmetsp:Transcript_4761/g.20379  ORF Transcript_4761/g.20379 Transcript_4761/m.20379 type:complete len:243 (-) Transcript_4761:161-889(-)